MGDLSVDTAVQQVGEGHYRATLSPDWEIWGPMGGYVAACALRAIGATAPDLTPATFSCHYLSVGKWGEVDLRVEPRKVGRGARSYRVEMTQADRPVLDGMIWATAPGEGLEHDEAVAPDVPGPDHLPSFGDLMPGSWPPYPFWNNVESRPIDLDPTWPPTGPGPALARQWMRFLPTATFDDVWADAARCVILIDLPSWPSVQNRHAWRQAPFIAPTLDLNIAFHRSAAGHDWLLCDGAAPVSTCGLFGWTSKVWSPDGQLHASGGGQCKYRKLEGAPTA